MKIKPGQCRMMHCAQDSGTIWKIKIIAELESGGRKAYVGIKPNILPVDSYILWLFDENGYSLNDHEETYYLGRVQRPWKTGTKVSVNCDEQESG